jgi:hypothetical protein
VTQTHPESARNIQVSQPREPTRVVWFVSAFVVMAVILVAGISWSLAHPLGIHWDEAEYLNQIQIDGQRLRTGHILKLAGQLLIKNVRPPAYRLLGFPFVGAFGYHTTGARLVSLACFALSALFVFLAARRVSTPTAGAFAALIFALSPEVVSASIFFGTDTALYLATAAMLYYIFAIWCDGDKQTNNWIGLGCSVGFGFLAKTTFILLAIPALGFWFVINQWTHLKLPLLGSQRKAGVLAFLISAPWWLLNANGAIAYARYARGFSFNSLGPPSLTTWMKWLDSVFRCLLGPGLSILIGLVLATLIVKRLKKQLVFSDLQIAAVGTCVCAGLPIIAAQLSGTNHLLRHITPSVVPLAVTVGIFACTSGWVASWTATVLSLTLFFAQAGALILPVIRPNQQALDDDFVNGAIPSRTMIRFDQWDWLPAMTLADACHLDAPEISFFGGGRNLNPPQIKFPWVVRATSTRNLKLAIPNATWLWRHEEGPPDWRRIMESADQSDMVITAPQFTGEIAGKADPDDQYNAEFEKRLLQDPLFNGPFFYPMGRFTPVEVAIFVKKDHPCYGASMPQ